MSTRTSIVALPNRIHADQRTLFGLALLSMFVLAAISVARVSGQEAGAKYDTIAMHPALTEAMIKQVESTTKSFISTGNGNPKLVTAYFGLYVPAKLTALDGVKDIPAIVDEVGGYIARAARSNRPDITQKITVDAFGGLKKVAEGNYHPAGRISAIVLMSRLDQKQADNQSKTPPVPYLQVLPILMTLYENDKNVDGVRAAALQGIHRHVSYNFPGIPAAARDQISKDMTALLDSKPEMFRTDRSHAYLQRYAVDILSSLRAANDSSLGSKLISISTKADSLDLIALHSAARIGELGKQLQGKVADPEKVLSSWSTRALAAFESEVKRLKSLDRLEPAASQPKDPEQFLNKDAKKAPTSRDSMMDDMMGDQYGSSQDMSQYGDMMGGPDMSGYEDMMGGQFPGMVPEAKPQPPEVSASRRKLNHVLQQLHMGVTGKPTVGIPTKDPGGLLASVPEDKKAAVTAWVTSMESIVTALNDKTLDDRVKYLEGLELQVESLRELVGEAPEQVFGADDDMASDVAPRAADDLLVGAQ